MRGRTFTRYWPWWVAVAWLLLYEGYALATSAPTLSRMVWRGQVAWPGLAWVATGVIVVLWVHFFIKVRR